MVWEPKVDLVLKKKKKKATLWATRSGNLTDMEECVTEVQELTSCTIKDRGSRTRAPAFHSLPSTMSSFMIKKAKRGRMRFEQHLHVYTHTHTYGVAFRRVNKYS